MQLAVAVSLADPGSEDESCSRLKRHVTLVVHQALEKKLYSSKAPTWRASCRCFTTDSLPRGYSGQLFGLRRIADLSGLRKETHDLYWFGPSTWSSNNLTSSRR